MREKRLDAVAGGVGPFELDGVGAERFGFPGADVADFAVVIVVPALAGDRVGDGFREFMGTRGSEGGEEGDSAEATGAAGERHGGVEDAVGGGVMVAAEILAACGAALLHLRTGREKDEV